MDPQTLKAALQRWSSAMSAAAPELNTLDGQLGDGDLGATLEKCAANVQAALPDLPERLEDIFKGAAQACAKASGSSFGTLLAVAFLGAAKWVPPREALTRADLSALLAHTVQALSARGGASLGDKTMLDALDAIARALGEAGDQDDLRAVARAAAAEAITAMRGKPNRIGRARMFAEKSMGMDDPGMVAVLRMTEAL
ncbi:PTS-dependent dihydroxyacetone kinase, ADP-binding subunit DhaL [Variovorax sp. PBL-H6]|uniref:DAK2 domain-containing protein n=1 Tax=Variovorax sp. PBL-H6 TaxID=434009 RepID=UPI0013178626|nr:DAK2 domain-containing protein [Variovorax sp. PBL-H6]VTU38327.1 PTS-dependent dihydroxyacetone kinase, ADP-binding subunit DhaL [Variovorax sp. PBL-H6]